MIAFISEGMKTKPSVELFPNNSCSFNLFEYLRMFHFFMHVEINLSDSNVCTLFTVTEFNFIIFFQHENKVF